MRSRLALFDIMFRSNATGSIAGAPYEISTSAVQDGRQTTWRAKRVPVASFGALAGGLLSETGNAIKEGAKSVLDRLRKPKSDELD